MKSTITGSTGPFPIEGSSDGNIGLGQPSAHVDRVSSLHETLGQAYGEGQETMESTLLKILNGSGYELVPILVALMIGGLCIHYGIQAMELQLESEPLLLD